MGRTLQPPPRRKWLNIVLDLNGILCHTSFKSNASTSRPYSLEDNVLCHRTPTIIGPKAVFARPNVGKFLRQVSLIADKVLVWTSMLKRNAEPIAGHLFRGCREPYDILSQNQCSTIELSPGKSFQLGQKVLYMKVLSETLFSNPSGETSFSPGNTLLIDDSPQKSICNENGNAVFFRTWSPQDKADDLLMGELLPWLRRLDCQEEGHLQGFVEANRIGLDPLRAGDGNTIKLVNAMLKSSQTMGTRFRLPGIGLVVEDGHVRD